MKRLHAIRVDLVGTVALAPDKLALIRCLVCTVLRRQALQCVGECVIVVAYIVYIGLGLVWPG